MLEPRGPSCSLRVKAAAPGDGSKLLLLLLWTKSRSLYEYD
jgi:hypothetical protein